MLVAADTKYWLYVNGKLLVIEGGLKRGPTPTGGYYDVVDLGAHANVLNFGGGTVQCFFCVK